MFKPANRREGFRAEKRFTCVALHGEDHGTGFRAGYAYLELQRHACRWAVIVARSGLAAQPLCSFTLVAGGIRSAWPAPPPMTRRQTVNGTEGQVVGLV